MAVSPGALWLQLWMGHGLSVWIERLLGVGLANRHVASRIVPDITAAEHRISSTDVPNASDILENRLYVDEAVPGS
jgi:hypothetical protein